MARIHKTGREAIRRAAWRFYNLFVCGAALVWRTLLFRTKFIGLTGSVGKTAAKDCLAAILSSRYPAVATIGSDNGRHGVPRTILRTRPWHRFSVIEIGTDKPGHMIRSALLVRPDIVLMLSVARTHTDAFKTLEETAAEKAKLLRFLTRRGVAVLNGDDSRVAAMARSVRSRVVLFGSSPEFDVWADDARGDWPERLEFQACSQQESHRVRTRLVGKHWVPSVTGALATSEVCGVPLAEAAKAVENVEPFRGRMQPASLDNGAVILRDECNGSVDTMVPAFEVLRRAKAARRVVVVSDCSDLKKRPRERLKHLAKAARESAEAVVFVGERASYGAKYAIAEGMRPQDVHHFVNLQDAAVFLREELKPGDLVLLKGRASHHLSRIYFALSGTVKCWRPDCSLRMTCDECIELGFTPGTASRPSRGSSGFSAYNNGTKK